MCIETIVSVAMTTAAMIAVLLTLAIPQELEEHLYTLNLNHHQLGAEHDLLIVVSQEHRCASRPLLQLQYDVGRQTGRLRCQKWCHCGRMAQLFHPCNSDPFFLMFSSMHQYCINAKPDTSEVKLSKDAWPSVAHAVTITLESGAPSSFNCQG